MYRIVSDLTALSQLVELHSLHFEGLESLANDRMTTEITTHCSSRAGVNIPLAQVSISAFPSLRSGSCEYAETLAAVDAATRSAIAIN
jgi:hypothetical protein